MSNLEYRILTKILKEGTLHPALVAGLKEDYFEDIEARQIWRFFNQHWYNQNTFRTIPTLNSIQRKWPSFQPTGEGKEALTALIEDLRSISLDLDAKRIAAEFEELVTFDTSCDAIRKMRDKINELLSKAERSEEFTIRDVVKYATEHYANAKSGAVYGIPWPWDCLTHDTLGKRKGNLIVFYARMKSMKCVCEGQRIMTPSGNMVPIEDLPEETVVPSYTAETGKMRFARARRVVSGIKDCVEVVTTSGLRLRTSNEHLYMVPGGYKRINELSPGDYVATARSLPQYQAAANSMTPENAYFLGLLVGDGNYTRSEVQVTSADPELVAAFEKHAVRFGCRLVQAYRPIEYRIVAKIKGSKENQVLNWLREIGAHGKKSIDKEVPRCIFESPLDSIAAFLAGLMDTDGNVSKSLFWSTSSKKLSLGIQHLLMRFGLRGRIQELTTNMGTKTYPVYLHDNQELAILNVHIGPHMRLTRKKKRLEEMSLTKEGAKRNKDYIPYRPELEESILVSKGEQEWPKSGQNYYDQTKLFAYKNRISRWKLNQLAEAFGSEDLKKEANNDVFWDEIKSITPIGKMPCYDICIEDGQDPNFVVEGYVVHNTWLTLYCAVNDYIVNNCRVLIWSREMSKEDLCLRVASLMTRVDYQLFKKGRLPPRKEKEMFDALQTLMSQEDDLDSKDMRDGAAKGRRHLLILAGRNVPRDTAALQVVIDKYQPSIVYLDSFYHLDPTGASSKMQRWERLAKLSEIVKAMGQDNAIPFVAVHQANRMGEKTHGNTLADLADTDVLAREADLIMRILKRRGKELYEDEYEVVRDNPEPATPSRVFKKKGPELVKEANNAPSTEDEAPRVGAELAVVLGGNREGVLEAFTIHAVPGYNFSLISSDYSTQEISQWLKEDDEPKPLKASPRPEKEPDGRFNKNAFRQYLKSN